MKRSVLSLSILMLASPLFAATKTTTFTVKADVVADCTIAATNLQFGNYDPVGANASADLYANSTVTVACTKGTPNVWIGLNTGSNNASATGTTRAMSAGGGNFLSYELYTLDPTSNPAAVWGNTQASGKSYTPVSKAATDLTVFGRIPQAQDAATGSYSDTITATVNY